MEILTVILEGIIFVFLLIITIKLFLQKQKKTDITQLTEMTRQSLNTSNRELRQELTSNIQSNIKAMGDSIETIQKNLGESQSVQLTEIRAALNQKLSDMDAKLNQNLLYMNTSISEKQAESGKMVNETLKNLENRFRTLEQTNSNNLENMRLTISRRLIEIQEDNQKKLDTIQNTVNEKLDEQLRKSFSIVSERLEKVYTSLGEMQTIAAGVGDLKKVLTNVKTRGILGEIQLGSILEEILAPEQYEKEIPTIPGSTNRVEFAVKLPGQTENEHIWLPIDSKFPGDTYNALQNAYDAGNKETIEAARKTLETAVKKCAKDIREKYVSPPYTTNFGIMFLPFEGLYAEVINSGLVEVLQRDYHVSITGPSTMAAMLNSMQMGFQTLAIQKRSSEVWEILGAVKMEFNKFNEVLEKAQKHIMLVEKDLDELVGARTKKIHKRLEKIESSNTPL